MKQFNLEEYLKNPSKKVVTRDGRTVKIHCTNYDSRQPIIAELEYHNFSSSFTKDGRYYNDDKNSPYDLFLAPEKHEGWLNVWEAGDFQTENRRYCGSIFNSEEEAKIHGKGSLATIKIEWEE